MRQARFYIQNLKTNKTMSNIEKYNNIFVEVFGIEPSVLNESFSKIVWSFGTLFISLTL